MVTRTQLRAHVPSLTRPELLLQHYLSAPPDLTDTTFPRLLLLDCLLILRTLIGLNL